MAWWQSGGAKATQEDEFREAHEDYDAEEFGSPEDYAREVHGWKGRKAKAFGTYVVGEDLDERRGRAKRSKATETDAESGGNRGQFKPGNQKAKGKGRSKGASALQRAERKKAAGITRDVKAGNSHRIGRIAEAARKKRVAEENGDTEVADAMDKVIVENTEKVRQAAEAGLRKGGLQRHKNAAAYVESMGAVDAYISSAVDNAYGDPVKTRAAKKKARQAPRGAIAYSELDETSYSGARFKSKARVREEEKVGFVHNANRTDEENEELFQKKRTRYIEKYGDIGRGSEWRFGLRRSRKRFGRNIVDGAGQEAVGARLSRRTGIIGGMFAVVRGLGARARLLAVVGLLVGILFIPSSFFTFAGWAIAALAMTLVSAVYVAIVNIFKVVASGVLAFVNMLFTLGGSGISTVMEYILSMGIFKTPVQQCDIAGGESFSRFCSGREIVADGLVPAGALNALNVQLMDPAKFMPEVKGGTLIGAIMRRLGFDDFNLGLGVGLNKVLNNAVEGGNPYVLMLVFLIPVALLGWLAWAKVVKPALQNAGAMP